MGRESEAEAKGKKNATPPTRTVMGLGRWSRPAGGGGGGVRVMETGRGRKGPLDGRTLG